MEDMKGDMGGAAAVTGLMHALARRRARANVVGVIGIVENMPSGTAMRPGDVVRSMKGDTVEIVNTDAEGRLVLADLLWYVQERFKPAGIVDLATLTGAILTLSASAAFADGRGRDYDRRYYDGRGWEHRHHHHHRHYRGPAVYAPYYAPAPVYYGPPPPVVYERPYYAPRPAVTIGVSPIVIPLP